MLGEVFAAITVFIMVAPLAAFVIYLVATLCLYMWRSFMDDYNGR